ncbi:MAG: hypothetical protein JHC95_07755 [Solirubrobacteraceae bacterium]|nr:hypothetical protein [Solirubrobacteraceae bacterium]
MRRRLLLAFLPLCVLAATAAPAQADPRCDLPGAIVGGPTGETLDGTSGPDIICGGGGNDTINGLGGNDVLVGGPDDDTIEGGPGEDELVGQSGADRLTGGAGRDLASYADRTADITVNLNGLADDGAIGEGDRVDADDVTTGSGDDVVNATPIPNRIETGPGEDVVRARAGVDLVIGGDDDDRLDGGQGVDEVQCGSGADAYGADPQDTFADCEASVDARGAAAPGESVATSDHVTCVILPGGTDVGCAGDPNKNFDSRRSLGIFVGFTSWPSGPATAEGAPYLHRIPLGAGRKATAIRLGVTKACAILETGRVLCWGGWGGGYGVPSTPSAAATADAGLLQGRKAVRFVSDRCVMADDATLHCLDVSGGTTRATIVRPPSTAGALSDAVDFGGGFCGIFTGVVRCWSQGSSTLGPAIALGVGRTAVKLAAGITSHPHACVIVDDGGVRCFGSGALGQLGRPGTASTDTAAPVELGAGRTAVDIAVGRSHTCAVLDDGAVRCWGQGFFGATGQGNTRNIGDDETPGSVPPVDLGGGRTAARLARGELASHTCVTLTNGQVQCWGGAFYRQLITPDRQTIGDNETPAALGPADLGGDL